MYLNVFTATSFYPLTNGAGVRITHVLWKQKIFSDERNKSWPVKPDLRLLLLWKPHETSLLELKIPKLNAVIQHIHWILLHELFQNKSKTFYIYIYIYTYLYIYLIWEERFLTKLAWHCLFNVEEAKVTAKTVWNLSLILISHTNLFFISSYFCSLVKWFHR